MLHVSLCEIEFSSKTRGRYSTRRNWSIQSGMILSDIFERYVEKSPVSVMARAAMEVALAPAALDDLFLQHAEKQYPRKLLFSTMVELMGVVVSKTTPSMHAAFQRVKTTLPFSVAALYDKLNGLEPGISAALVIGWRQSLNP